MKRSIAYSIRATFVAMLALSLLACKPKPTDEEEIEPRIKFSAYAEYYPENGGLVSLPVKIYDVDEKHFPITVTFSISAYNDVVVDEWVALQDKGNYTVTFEAGDTEAPIYFYMINNNELQEEMPAIQFTLESTSTPEAPLSKPNYTIIRITDDEKAPRVASGQYEARYTLPEEAEVTREESGYFPLTIAKTGKYEYVAYGWFGLNRPRLIGTFDPVAKTLTFDGSDYDLSVDDARVSAFGRAYYYNDEEMTEVLVFRGAGTDGKQPIVLNTDDIGINKTGYITTAASNASFDIHVDNKENKLPGEFLGVYDMMPEGASFKHKTVIDEEKYEDEDMNNDPTTNENQEVMSRTLKSLPNPAGVIEIAEPFVVVE
ncbi:MAG: hypothetical protein J6Q40_06115 [Tidjanibacter sp.]|nr:hypothetical protein [Tidjanibacter sp.]